MSRYNRGCCMAYKLQGKTVFPWISVTRTKAIVHHHHIVWHNSFVYLLMWQPHPGLRLPKDHFPQKQNHSYSTSADKGKERMPFKTHKSYAVPLSYLETKHGKSIELWIVLHSNWLASQVTLNFTAEIPMGIRYQTCRTAKEGYVWS